jgi:hypothetical protein
MDGHRGERGATRRALIGPLLMLAGGAVASVVLWRVLMVTSPHVGERLTSADRSALDDVIRRGGAN